MLVPVHCWADPPLFFQNCIQKIVRRLLTKPVNVLFFKEPKSLKTRLFYWFLYSFHNLKWPNKGLTPIREFREQLHTPGHRTLCNGAYVCKRKQKNLLRTFDFVPCENKSIPPHPEICRPIPHYSSTTMFPSFAGGNTTEGTTRCRIVTSLNLNDVLLGVSTLRPKLDAQGNDNTDTGSNAFTVYGLHIYKLTAFRSFNLLNSVVHQLSTMKVIWDAEG